MTTNRKNRANQTGLKSQEMLFSVDIAAGNELKGDSQGPSASVPAEPTNSPIQDPSNRVSASTIGEYQELIPQGTEMEVEPFYIDHPLPIDQIVTMETWRLIHILQKMKQHSVDSSVPNGEVLITGRKETQRLIHTELSKRPRLDLEKRMMIHRAAMAAIMHNLPSLDVGGERASNAIDREDAKKLFIENNYPLGASQCITSGAVFRLPNTVGNILEHLPEDQRDCGPETYFFEQIPVEWYYKRDRRTMKKVDNIWFRHPVDAGAFEQQPTNILYFLFEWFSIPAIEHEAEWGTKTFSVSPKGKEADSRLEEARHQTKETVIATLDKRQIVDEEDQDRLHWTAVSSQLLPLAVLVAMKANRVPAAMLDTIPNHELSQSQNRAALTGTGSCAAPQRLELWSDHPKEPDKSHDGGLDHWLAAGCPA